MFFNAFFALLRTYLRTWRGSCLAVVCYDILYQVSYQNRKPIRTFSSAHPSLPFATLALTAKVWTRCRVCDSWCVQLGCKYWRWRHGLAPWLIKRGFRLTHVHIFDYFWLFLTTISPEQSLHSKAKWYIGTSYSSGDALHGIVVHMPIAETAVFLCPGFVQVDSRISSWWHPTYCICPTRQAGHGRTDALIAPPHQHKPGACQDAHQVRSVDMRQVGIIKTL